MPVKRDSRMDDIDGYSQYLRGALERRYSPDQRTLIAAALAERWLATHEKTAGRQETAVLRETLEAVWMHVQGKRITPADLDGMLAKVIKVEPATRSDEMNMARCAWETTRLALECCARPENVDLALQAALAACKAVVLPIPGDQSDPGVKKQVWRQPTVQAEIDLQPSVQKEIARQVNLLKLIGEVTSYDEQAVKVLRRFLL